jgi:hypothetical protein
MDIKSTTRFRLWVQRIWMDNCEERLIVGEDPVTINQYWNNYKYWLKREYKHQQRQNNG